NQFLRKSPGRKQPAHCRCERRLHLEQYECVSREWHTFEARPNRRLGFFSIHQTGKRISITVSKEGFYTPPSERLRSYEYANPGDGLFTPDPANPVVFHLRKKGAGADLITSQYGVKSYFGVRLPLDGT